MPTLAEVRDQFPALAGDTIFLENAGGSQVPSCVINAISDYMRNSYVQLGAPYQVAERATQTVDNAHEFINLFMNGVGIGEVALGPSCTQLVTMLAECYSRNLKPGDEIIICETAHEANAGPWEKLARFGFILKTWKIDPLTYQCSLEDLEAMLTERTKIVAFPHVSNLLGEIVDAQAICALIRSGGAISVVDGVAFAPHRAIDVRELGADWYVYSTYKVFGPHMAALFGRAERWAELEGPNHFFVPASTYKFELGGTCHEGCAGLLALRDYMGFVSGSAQVGRNEMEEAWKTMTAFELPLQERLLSFLGSKPGIKVVGPESSGPNRVCTISFLSEKSRPDQICEETRKANIGIRYGHMYAYRLCVAAGINLDLGVTRVSMSHYNTLEEIDRLITVLDPII
ncbi:MAG: aminotransferase class V-fold PLP-dependent enzyme [Fimbriimonadaceae bacterium]